MDDRFNTVAGWVLFAGIIALGFSVLSYKYFHADNPERPEQLGYVIEGAEQETTEVAEMSMAQVLNMMSADDQIAAGERVFAKCSACHTVEQGGANGIGPNLYAVMGAGIGNHVPGYAYSDALAGVGGVWDWEMHPVLFARDACPGRNVVRAKFRCSVKPIRPVGHHLGSDPFDLCRGCRRVSDQPYVPVFQVHTSAGQMLQSRQRCQERRLPITGRTSKANLARFGPVPCPGPCQPAEHGCTLFNRSYCAAFQSKAAVDLLLC